MSCDGSGRACSGMGVDRGQPDTEMPQMTGRDRKHCPDCGAFLRSDGGCTRCDRVCEQLALEKLGSAALSAPGTDKWVKRTPVLQRALDNAMAAYSDTRSGLANLREAFLGAPRDQERFYMIPSLWEALSGIKRGQRLQGVTMGAQRAAETETSAE